MPSKPSTPRTLGIAVWSDNVALVRELLDAGAPVDNYGSDTAADVTPLMESVDELEPFHDASRLVLTQILLLPVLTSRGATPPDVLPCTAALETTQVTHPPTYCPRTKMCSHLRNSLP